MENSKLTSIKAILKLFSKRPAARSPQDLAEISKLVRKNKFLQQISEENDSADIITEVSKALTIEIFEPGDCVINFGEIGEKFYIVLVGLLGVLIPSFSDKKTSPSEIKKSLSRRSLLQDSEIKQRRASQRAEIEMIKEFESFTHPNQSEFLNIDSKIIDKFNEIETMTEVSSLQDGDSFGELALLSEKPRATTVEAKEVSVLAVLSKQDFKKILSQEAEKKMKEKVNFLVGLPIFKGCTKQLIQKLSYYFQELKFNKGQFVYKENFVADKLYFIYSGEFKISRTKDHSKRKVIDYPGGFFSYQNNIIKIDKARDISEGILLQVAIKGKNEIFGYEEYVNNIPLRTQNCLCISDQSIVYSITNEV